MRGRGLTDAMLWPCAAVLVLATDGVWPRMAGGVRRVLRLGPLERLHARIGRLPAVVALPLFLVPEVCSRLGWVVSAWLLLQGDAWRALAVYVGTKLVAGSIALWVCSACLPALLRVPAFAAVHGAAMRVHARLGGWLRRPGEPGRFGRVVAELRARRAKQPVAGPAPLG